MSNQNLTIGVLVAIVIAIGGYLYPHQKAQATPASGAVSDTTNYSKLETASLAVGASGCDDSYASCTGTLVTQELTGTCTLTAYANVTAWAATTTKLHYCAVTNLVAGDKVFVSLPNPGGVQGMGLGTQQGTIQLSGQAFATSSGILEIALFNGFGAATSSYPQATTSVPYWIVR